MFTAPSKPLTREDLDNALQQGLQQGLRLALVEIGENVRAVIREDLQDAVNQITEACANGSSKSSSPETQVPQVAERENSLTLLNGGGSRTLAVGGSKGYDSASTGGSSRGLIDQWSNPPSARDAYVRLQPADRIESGDDKKISPTVQQAFKRQAKVFVDDPMTPWRERLVRSDWFESMTGVLVSLNVLVLGLETNAEMTNGGMLPAPWGHVSEIMEVVFCLLFVTEWVLRVSVHRTLFFCDPEDRLRNWFDTWIIGLQVLELSCKYSGIHFRGISLIKDLRILRICRLLNISHDLSTRVTSIMKSLSSLASTVSLLLMLIYAFSVFFTQMALRVPVQNHALIYWFGSVPRTALSLLETVAGGVSWDEPCMVVFDNMGPISGWIYLFYTSFGVFVMLNVIMGVFIDKAIKIAEEQTELDVACAISGAFVNEGDRDDDCGITREIFNAKLEEPELQDCFRVLNIDLGQAPVLFGLIDADGSGSVDAAEIVEGCLRLKGSAKSLDVSIMEQALFKLVEKVENNVVKMDTHMRLVDGHLNKLGVKFGLEPTPNIFKESGKKNGQKVASTTV